VQRFLTAFENLDLDAFIACFDDDATVFFPTPEPPQRFDGKAAVRAHFSQVFAAIRQGSQATAPPYHRLAPEDLTVQPLGRDAALVSFHLRNAERIARRTLVLSRGSGGWTIRHLHASNVAREPAPAAGDARPKEER
jgi:ketosteroid isomerase-like protein